VPFSLPAGRQVCFSFGQAKESKQKKNQNLNSIPKNLQLRFFPTAQK